jgi:hypothetical protein
MVTHSSTTDPWRRSPGLSKLTLTIQHATGMVLLPKYRLGTLERVSLSLLYKVSRRESIDRERARESLARVCSTGTLHTISLEIHTTICEAVCPCPCPLYACRFVGLFGVFVPSRQPFLKTAAKSFHVALCEKNARRHDDRIDIGFEISLLLVLLHNLQVDYFNTLRLDDTIRYLVSVA